MGHLEISASTLESVLAFKHKHYINGLLLELKVLSIFIKHVIYSKVGSYRLELCNFVRERMAKTSCGKFSEILRVILQSPCWKSSVVESVLNNIVEINSRPVTILKKSFHQGHFLVDTLEFSTLFRKRLIYAT